MRTWQQRGYGQGRKKKTRDVSKAIENRRGRVKPVEKPWSQWKLQLAFGSTGRSGDSVLRLDEAVATRGDFRLGPISLDVRVGERVAVKGPNGSGKSTLLEVMLASCRSSVETGAPVPPPGSAGCRRPAGRSRRRIA